VPVAQQHLEFVLVQLRIAVERRQPPAVLGTRVEDVVDLQRRQDAGGSRTQRVDQLGLHLDGVAPSREQVVNLEAALGERPAPERSAGRPLGRPPVTVDDLRSAGTYWSSVMRLCVC
jgi:hypothetical protein